MVEFESHGFSHINTEVGVCRASPYLTVITAPTISLEVDEYEDLDMIRYRDGSGIEHRERCFHRYQDAFDNILFEMYDWSTSIQHLILHWVKGFEVFQIQRVALTMKNLNFLGESASTALRLT